MNAARFQYGFHPKGVDPLQALRSGQPGTVPCGPTPGIMADRIPTMRAGLPANVTKVGLPGSVNPTISRNLPIAGAPAYRPIRSGSKGHARKLLWLLAVGVSVGIGGLVLAFERDSTNSEGEPLLALSPPTVLEPDPMPEFVQDLVIASTSLDGESAPTVQPSTRAPAPSNPSIVVDASKDPAPSPKAESTAPLPHLNLPGIVVRPDSTPPAAPSTEPVKSEPVKTAPPVMRSPSVAVPIDRVSVRTPASPARLPRNAEASPAREPSGNSKVPILQRTQPSAVDRMAPIKR